MSTDTPRPTATIDAFTDHELAAELDRRAAAKRIDVLFYGVWPGTRAGHYVHDRHACRVWDTTTTPAVRPGGLYPWDTRERERRQEEGKLWHWHHPTDEKTLLMLWDRSEDQRGNCCSTFIVSRIVTPERGLDIAREAFPSVFERIEAHLGRPVVLSGASS